MRPIKLRGRVIEAPDYNNALTVGEWVEGFYYTECGNHYIMQDNQRSGKDLLKRNVLYQVDPETVGQFTGLLDKNSKEIYDGDVVKWDDCSNGRYWRFAVVVIYPDITFNCARIVQVGDILNSSADTFRFGSFMYKDTYNHLMVIGNIHDNPELIK